MLIAKLDRKKRLSSPAQIAPVVRTCVDGVADDAVDPSGDQVGVRPGRRQRAEVGLELCGGAIMCAALSACPYRDDQ